VKVAQESAALEQADLDNLKHHGLTDSDIWDLGSIAAFFSFSNRMANMSAMRPNSEFYTMGRG
jgi:alkylhydroperoxidase family enzyme